MSGLCLGLDTSNYTTSVALVDGTQGRSRERLLDVPRGTLGLRQSDAVFQHVRRLPALMADLAAEAPFGPIAAVGASVRPRDQEDSYMPCFLVGKSQGESLAAALGVPFFPCAHQQGHLAAAAWGAGHEELLDRPFLAWHLSGGTTELLHVTPQGHTVHAEKIGGTSDISAGQLIDRTGVLLGLAFPAGKALDRLYPQGTGTCRPFSVKLAGLTFSLSGMENKVKALAEEGVPPAEVARFTLDTVIRVVLRATQEALTRYPGLPVLCSGGVASNRQLREAMERACGALFAPPRYAADNAMGVAVLTRRGLEREEQREPQ